MSKTQTDICICILYHRPKYYAVNYLLDTKTTTNLWVVLIFIRVISRKDIPPRYPTRHPRTTKVDISHLIGMLSCLTCINWPNITQLKSD